MNVYFIGEKSSGPVKIGRSTDPRRRLRWLAMGAPKASYAILASCRAQPLDEQAVHKVLAGSKMTGEWFNRTKEVQMFIDFVSKHGSLPDVVAKMRDTMVRSQRKRVPQCATLSGDNPVSRVDRKFKRVGYSLAQACGVDRTQPFRWVKKRGGRIPDYHFAAIREASLRLRAGVTRSDLVV